MVIEYSYHVSHSYLVISNKTLIFYFVNSNRHKKSACGRKGLRLIMRSFLQVLDIAIITETSLINNIKENVSELVIITEVKFIKKFLHALCENCHR